MVKPDIFYIGYQRAASAFLRGFFTEHHQVYWDRKAFGYFANPQKVKVTSSELAEMESAKVYISMSEALCRSLIFTDTKIWPEVAFRKIDWSCMADKIDINPLKIAERLKANFSEARVLMVIRNQVEWLRSNYLHFQGNLKPRKRRFEDFCETAEGMAVLRAGMYDITVGAYRSVFGVENVKVLIFERLRTDYQSFIKELCNFLNIETIEYENVVVNKGKSVGRWLMLRFVPFSSHLLLPERIISRLKIALDKVPLSKKTVFSKEVCSLIKSYYGISNMRTAKMLNCDLSQYGY